MACGILVPQPGTDPAPRAMETQSLNHQTTSGVQRWDFLCNWSSEQEEARSPSWPRPRCWDQMTGLDDGDTMNKEQWSWWIQNKKSRVNFDMHTKWENQGRTAPLTRDDVQTAWRSGASKSPENSAIRVCLQHESFKPEIIQNFQWVG